MHVQQMMYHRRLLATLLFRHPSPFDKVTCELPRSLHDAQIKILLSVVLLVNLSSLGDSSRMFLPFLTVPLPSLFLRLDLLRQHSVNCYGSLSCLPGYQIRPTTRRLYYFNNMAEHISSLSCRTSSCICISESYFPAAHASSQHHVHT